MLAEVDPAEPLEGADRRCDQRQGQVEARRFRYSRAKTIATSPSAEHDSGAAAGRERADRQRRPVVNGGTLPWTASTASTCSRFSIRMTDCEHRGDHPSFSCADAHDREHDEDDQRDHCDVVVETPEADERPHQCGRKHDERRTDLTIMPAG